MQPKLTAHCLSIFAASCLTTTLAAQDAVDTFTLEASTATPMTGTSANGLFEVVGTAGQASAGTHLLGGPFDFLGGFWGVVLNEIFVVLWNPRGDSDFFNANNWDYEGTPQDDNELPTETDVVKFNPGTIIDIFLAPPTPKTAVIGALQILSGIVRFNFSKAALVLAGVTEPAGASLVVKGGVVGQTEAKFESFNPSGTDQLITSSIALESGALGAIGRLRIKSPTMSLLQLGDLNAGTTGEGELVVEGGALATSLGNVRLGASPGGKGNAFVRENGSEWLLLGDVFAIGEDGIGNLTIQAGGLVEATTDLVTVGEAYTANGVVSITDAGSRFQINGGVVDIGQSGTGAVGVSNNAELVVNSASQFAIGAESGAGGLLALNTGATAAVHASRIVVGDSGNGNLTISGAAVLTSTVLGFQPIDLSGSIGGTSLTSIVGAGSRWTETTSTGKLRIGWAGPATLALGGGTLDIPDVTVYPKGKIIGSGTIEGNVLNVGSIFPNTALQSGQLEIDGSYQQAALSSNIAGSLTAVTSGSSATPVGVKCSGFAEVSGGLLISSGLNAPTAGQSFTVVDAAGVSGTFDVTFVDGIPNLRANVQYPATDSKGGGDVTIIFDVPPESSGLDSASSDPIDFLPSGAVLSDIDGNDELDLVMIIPEKPAIGGDPGHPPTVQVIYNLAPDGSGGLTNDGQANFALASGAGIVFTALATGDLDGDGLNDVLVANGASAGSLIALRSTGTSLELLDYIEFHGLSAPMALATTDLNGDARADVIVGMMGDDTIEVMASVGPKSFTIQTIPLIVGSVPCSIDPTDIDGDSDVDFAVAMAGTSKVQVYINAGDGVFATAPAVDLSVGTKPIRVVARDVASSKLSNGPSLPDLFTLDKIGGTVSVLINQTDPQELQVKFANAVSLPVGLDPRSIAFIDSDEDGDLDLVVAVTDGGEQIARKVRNDVESGQVNFNAGDAIASSDGARIVLAGDLDHDGLRDLLVITVDGGVADGGFAAPISARVSPNSILVVGDISGDGIVNAADLALLLGGWGICSNCSSCPADLDGSCKVDAADLAILLGAWTVSTNGGRS